MGQIAATYDLMPESTDVDLDVVKDSIAGAVPSGVKVLEINIEPVAFGLKKIVLGVLIDDSVDNVGNDLEEGLLNIPGIENMECTSSTLL